MQHLVDVTLVINLSRDTKKLADMTSALQQQQIPFERLDAVDGSKVRRSASSCGSLCTDGMLGCSRKGDAMTSCNASGMEGATLLGADRDPLPLDPDPELC